MAHLCTFVHKRSTLHPLLLAEGGMPQCRRGSRRSPICAYGGGGGKVAKVDVACAIQVAICSIVASRTRKQLAATESMVNRAARATGLACVGFVDDLDVAAGISM